VAVVLGALGWLRRGAASEAPGGPLAAVAAPLTTDQGWEGHPTLSPDGSQVAFSANRASQDNIDVYLKLVGPGEPHRLTTDPAADLSPAWSPDGRRIAFLRRRDAEGRWAIYLIPALGGDERRLSEIDLTPFRSAPGTPLAWTPDGKWLAVAGRFGSDAPSEVWLIAPDTGERRRLTTAGRGQIGDFRVACSPDGRIRSIGRSGSGWRCRRTVAPSCSRRSRAAPAISCWSRIFTDAIGLGTRRVSSPRRRARRRDVRQISGDRRPPDSDPR
jgi:Tol biopolymer transport system component